MSLFALTAYGLLCALLCRLIPRRMRWPLLLLCSLGFYASRALSGLPFLLITLLCVWLCALGIEAIGRRGEASLATSAEKPSPEMKKSVRLRVRRRQRLLMLLALLVCFGLLGVFKYTDDLRGWMGREPLGLLLPLGISFYTFQAVSYLLDVANRKIAAQRNPFKLLLFLSFFPQLIQGPIGRYDALAPQLLSPPDVDFEAFARGSLLILWGLFKKLVIADRAAPAVEAAFSGGTGSIALVGVLLYALQQYCDFSGGIDLVTGIAETLGVRLAENFRRPYFSVSLADFWRRWHISLGAWMRDYVFYPFALFRPVSRLSKAAKRRFGASFARALPAALGNLLVFFLVGLWHGAAGHYLAWGLYNGLVLAASVLLEPAYKRWNEEHAALAASRGFHIFRVLRTFAIVNIGWFFDRSATVPGAFNMMGSLFAASPAPVLPALGLSAPDAWVLSLSAVLLFSASLAVERGADLRSWVLSRPLPLRWTIALLGILAVVILGVWGSGFNEASFIYYKL